MLEKNSEFKVLDHGFIRVVDFMGGDSSIVQGARVSYGKGTKSISSDEKLIAYLWRNQHMSPFEMCEIKLHIKLPIFVMRQWARHRTSSINEVSARYSEVIPEFFEPVRKDIASQSAIRKQGRGKELSEAGKEDVLKLVNQVSRMCLVAYNDLLDLGVSRELARIVLPVNFYTEFYWKIDLRNFLHFLKLRNDEKAQLEIRRYAKVLQDEILAKWCPFVHSVFTSREKNE